MGGYRKEWLFPLFLVVRAPGGIGAFRAMASAAPVPFAAIAQEDIHSQGPLDSYFKFIRPPWSFSSHRDIIKPLEVRCNLFLPKGQNCERSSQIKRKLNYMFNLFFARGKKVGLYFLG